MEVVFFILLICGPLLASASRTKRDIININTEVDEILTNISQILTITGQDVVALSDYQVTYVAKWDFIKATVDFTATNGKGWSLATLQRTGDALRSATPSAVTIKLNLGLGHIQASYDYHLQFSKLFHSSGEIGATVHSFSLGALLTLYVDEEEETCQAVLDSATVDEFGDIDIDVSGLGVLDWTMEKILESTTRELSDDLQTKLQDGLSNAIVKQLNKQEVCELLYTL